MKNRIDPAYLPHYLELAEEISYAGIDLRDIAEATLEIGYTQRVDMTDIEDVSVFNPHGNVVKLKSVAILEVTLQNGENHQIPIDRPIHYTEKAASIIEGTLTEEHNND